MSDTYPDFAEGNPRENHRVLIVAGSIVVLLGLAAAGVFVWSREHKKSQAANVAAGKENGKPTGKHGDDEEFSSEGAKSSWLSSPAMLVIAITACCLDLAIWVMVMVYVARDAHRRSFGTPAGWTLFILFTNWPGLLVYLIARPNAGLMVCSHCSQLKLFYVIRCPHCGSSAK